MSHSKQIKTTKSNKSKRQKLDFYPTPSWCVHRFLEKAQLPSSGYWLEPTAGDGSLIKSIYSFEGNWLHNCPIRNNVFAVELQERFLEDLKCVTPNVHIGDFLKYDFATSSGLGVKADVCIGNPPYGLAFEMVQHALKQAHVVCMLLRINFISSEKRASWMRYNTPDLYVLPNRPKFVNNRSDSCEYAWFVWGKNSTGKVVILDSTPKNQRNNG